MNYQNKKVTVVGLAKSGVAAAVLLKKLGAAVSVTEGVCSAQIEENAARLRVEGIAVETGAHTRGFMEGRDLAVISPGVGDDSLSLTWARELKIPIISEIELAWSVCPADVVAITGTNGKTTVTTLISKILELKNTRVFTLGNIGEPFSARVLEMKDGDLVSLEVSSFQLEGIVKFKPKVSVILNFAPDHLDKEHRGYNNISEYFNAKKRIFMNQGKDDYLVLNHGNLWVKELSPEARARVLFFNQGEGRDFELNPNHLAAMAVGSIFGISAQACLGVFRNFKGVEHRLEFVRVINGIKFVNDSKATNVDSTNWALRTVKEPTILIAGGRDKNIDYREISGLVKERVKLLILIGEARDKIRSAYKGLVPALDAATLEDAVHLGFKKAVSGDCVLLSPMCASFDMFDNFEHRGRIFKETVNQLSAVGFQPSAKAKK